MLIARSVENGTVVQPGTALLLLAIDERNLGKLAMAQTALAWADAYADQKFAATIFYINPGVDITKASVEVKLNVTTPPDYLRQDMTVSVDIAMGESKNALLLPGRSVNDQMTAALRCVGSNGSRRAHSS